MVSMSLSLGKGFLFFKSKTVRELVGCAHGHVSTNHKRCFQGINLLTQQCFNVCTIDIYIRSQGNGHREVTCPEPHRDEAQGRERG